MELPWHCLPTNPSKTHPCRHWRFLSVCFCPLRPSVCLSLSVSVSLSLSLTSDFACSSLVFLLFNIKWAVAAKSVQLITLCKARILDYAGLFLHERELILLNQINFNECFFSYLACPQRSSTTIAIAVIAKLIGNTLSWPVHFSTRNRCKCSVKRAHENQSALHHTSKAGHWSWSLPFRVILEKVKHTKHLRTIQTMQTIFALTDALTPTQTHV